MRVLVTGGCGFIGSWIVKGLVQQGHDVHSIDDLSGGALKNIVPYFGNGIYLPSPKGTLSYSTFDCANEQVISELFETFKPEVVYHLAANAREGASFFQPLSIVKRNTLAYTNILMNSIKYGVKRVILFSSIAVMGNQKPPFTEDMPRKPVDLYGLQKANMEQMTEMLAEVHGFEYIIFRPHNVYGPGQALNDPFRNVFGIWMNRIMREEPIQIYGDGQQTRAFSYIKDSLPCYISALDCNFANFTVNIGSDLAYPVYDAAVMTFGAMGKAVPIEYLPERHGEVKHAFMDHDLAKELFDFADTTNLGDGLIQMAEWAKQQGPQEWREGDPLELVNDLTPRNWVK